MINLVFGLGHKITKQALVAGMIGYQSFSYLVTQCIFTSNIVGSKVHALCDCDILQGTVCPSIQVSIRIFNSELLITLLHSFSTFWIQWICKFCLIYHSLDLEA